MKPSPGHLKYVLVLLLIYFLGLTRTQLSANGIVPVQCDLERILPALLLVSEDHHPGRNRRREKAITKAHNIIILLLFQIDSSTIIGGTCDNWRMLGVTTGLGFLARLHYIITIRYSSSAFNIDLPQVVAIIHDIRGGRPKTTP